MSKQATIKPEGVVFYHANCPDGLTAAWVANQRLTEDGWDLEFVEIYPNQEVLVGDVEQIWFLDICPTRVQLEELVKKGIPIVVVDHHKTNAWVVEYSEQLRMEGHWDVEVIFDERYSGAGNASRYFYGDQGPDVHPEVIPALVNYVEDRDLWAWKLPYSQEVSAAFSICDRNFEAVTEFAEQLQDESALFEELGIRSGSILRVGRALLKKDDMVIEAAAKRGDPILLGRYRVTVQNHTGLFSRVGEAMAKKSDEGVGGTWFVRDDGKVQFSLRSIPGGSSTARKVAAQFGGGGHEHAAGFAMELEELPALLTNLKGKDEK